MWQSFFSFNNLKGLYFTFTLLNLSVQEIFRVDTYFPYVKMMTRVSRWWLVEPLLKCIPVVSLVKRVRTKTSHSSPRTDLPIEIILKNHTVFYRDDLNTQSPVFHGRQIYLILSDVTEIKCNFFCKYYNLNLISKSCWEWPT